jgi:hypothetical protein
MRHVRRTLAATAAALLIGGSVVPGQTPATGRVMREKLQHTQDALEGLMTSDFALVSRAGDALAATTKLPAWAILETPEYERYSGSFLRATRKLQEAADRRDSDGAFMAYMGVTMTCFQCHRYIKGERIAR